MAKCRKVVSVQIKATGYVVNCRFLWYYITELYSAVYITMVSSIIRMADTLFVVLHCHTEIFSAF